VPSLATNASLLKLLKEASLRKVPAPDGKDQRVFPLSRYGDLMRSRLRESPRKGDQSKS
jgi:hypothetical protein